MKVRVVSTKDKNLAESQHAGGRLQDIIRRNRSSEALGLYAVCSAHPQVIAASAREAHENGSVLHVESTSSQVNQFGGYTGQNPEQFAGFVRSVAWDAGLSDDQVLLGGDHLGPFPWRSESASVAMDKACAPLFAHVYWLVIRKSTSTPAWLVPMTPSLDSMNEPLRIVLPYCAKRLRTLFVSSPQIHHLCCMLWELKYPRQVANQVPRNPFRSLLLAVSNALWTHSSELLISTD